jgi:phage terminase large subunit
MLSATQVLVGIVYEVCRLMCKHYRIVAHEGGTRSGKTWNILEYLVDLAIQTPFYEITIASRNMPHLKKGVIKDFRKIMTKRKMWNSARWHDSDKRYTFPNGAYIEFFNADDIGNASGPGRHVLYCNEVNFFKKPVFDQLLMRTTDFCIIDYNPIHPRHWLYTSVVNRKDCYLWRSTYLDNLQFLPKEQVLEIELMRENDPLRWQVYGLGLRASLQKGQIYGQAPNKPWVSITDREFLNIPEQEIFGLDWGYFPDPNAVCGVKALGNKRWIRKIVYETNQSDEALALQLQANGLKDDSIFIADHSKKSIVRLRSLGFPFVYAAVKGPGSVDEGIKLIQSKETRYVMDPDMDFEYLNYTYLLGPNEEPTGIPQDKHNHLLDGYRMVELYRDYL